MHKCKQKRHLTLFIYTGRFVTIQLLGGQTLSREQSRIGLGLYSISLIQCNATQLQ